MNDCTDEDYVYQIIDFDEEIGAGGGVIAVALTSCWERMTKQQRESVVKKLRDVYTRFPCE